MDAKSNQLSIHGKITAMNYFMRHKFTQNMTLVFNHVDAWVVAMISAGLALLVHDGLSTATLYLLAAITLGYWAAFALNDYYDAPFDAQDNEKGSRSFFVQRQVTGKKIALWSAFLTLLVTPAFLQFGLRGFLVLAVCLLIAWAYSAPPLRLKNRPIIDLITHATFVETFPYLMVLFLLDGKWMPVDGAIIVCTTLASLSSQLENQIGDYAIDRLQERNFTVMFGLNTAVWLLRLTTIGLVCAFTFFTFAEVIPLAFVPFGVVCLPIMWHRLRHSTPRPRWMTIWIVLAAGLYMVGLLLYWVAPPSITVL